MRFTARFLRVESLAVICFRRLSRLKNAREYRFLSAMLLLKNSYAARCQVQQRSMTNSMLFRKL